MASASLDHSAIYLRIAGTTILGADEERIGVWLGAAIGMTLKLARPGRFDRLAIVLYLLLGRSGVVVYETIASVVPSLSLWPLVIGGILYSIGILFLIWRACPFTTRSGMALCYLRTIWRF